MNMFLIAHNTSPDDGLYGPLEWVNIFKNH